MVLPLLAMPCSRAMTMRENIREDTNNKIYNQDRIKALIAILQKRNTKMEELISELKYDDLKKLYQIAITMNEHEISYLTYLKEGSLPFPELRKAYKHNIEKTRTGKKYVEHLLSLLESHDYLATYQRMYHLELDAEAELKDAEKSYSKTIQELDKLEAERKKK